MNFEESMEDMANKDLLYLKKEVEIRDSLYLTYLLLLPIYIPTLLLKEDYLEERRN